MSKLLRSPYAVMTVVLAMYVVKSAAKIAIGSSVNSPMIVGDGLHNLSDIGEALLVMAVIAVARRKSEDYPFGLKKFESFGEVAIGLSLLVMSASVARKALAGVLHSLPSLDAGVRAVLPLPDYQPLHMGWGNFGTVVALTAGSALVSLVVSRFQVRVGRETGHPSLVADGEETASDGRVEIATLAGILGEYAFRAPWLEYPFALVIAALIAKTGVEILRRGGETLLQRSIGREHEDAIRQAATFVPGIVGVDELKTFRSGGDAVCIMRAVTRAGAEAHDDLRYALGLRVERVLADAGFGETDLYVRFAPPPPERHRVAYAMTGRGDTVAFAASVAEATRFRVCDVEDGEIVRADDCVPPADLPAWLGEKRVCTLLLFGEDEAARRLLEPVGIAVERTCSVSPSSVGFD